MRGKNKSYIVYMHVCPYGGKRYVGATCQTLNGRAGLDGSKYKTNKNFWTDIQKYGWENFEHIIIARNLTQTDAWALEIQTIEKYKTTNEKHGYNKSIGGNLSNYGRHCSGETKKKLSEKNRGRIKSELERQKISASQKGRKHTLEHNKKVSEALKGKYIGKLSSAYGVKRSYETRMKMSESAKIGWEKRRAKLIDNK